MQPNNKIFLTRNWHEEAINFLREKKYEVITWDNKNPPTELEIIDILKDCVAIISEFNDIITSSIISSAPHLKVISNRAVGYENIDIKAAKDRDILVGNTPGVLVETCADFTMALLLNIARNITYSNRDVLKGKWQTFYQLPYLGFDIYNKSLGIIGLGQIGTAFAKRAINGFNMNTYYWSRNRKPDIEEQIGINWIDNINDLVANCEYISIHCALTPETHKIVGKEQFSLMKNVKLINTSRGATLDQDSLIDAINAGNIYAAALDVTDPEPPDYKSEIINHPKVLVTPHIGSASNETFKKMAMIAAQNIVNALEGNEMVSQVKL
tara:strand:+ start:29 stop:1003 length:975 start_codon:yes stop_codon:yes gene_type:complete